MMKRCRRLQRGMNVSRLLGLVCFLAGASILGWLAFAPFVSEPLAVYSFSNEVDSPNFSTPIISFSTTPSPISLVAVASYRHVLSHRPLSPKPSFQIIDSGGQTTQVDVAPEVRRQRTATTTTLYLDLGLLEPVTGNSYRVQVRFAEPRPRTPVDSLRLEVRRPTMAPSSLTLVAAGLFVAGVIALLLTRNRFDHSRRRD